ncbi:MAG: hypothetical protein PHW18_02325 [Sulfuricurvum sp.]|uniref:capsular polysaccharide export protein, LipB/KpsS family n=1 Tax=Sulfuricurvum sp. TaxID=2025608 RepID=UPI002612D74B|nr:hypothetical protein [Sulfuricurvum sp.]MDD2828391.1 hypothetical protein [Sulfuricurvum sp.]MDD4949396.1 hypothetical protein [Sulfuricurvum sp.]
MLISFSQTLYSRLKPFKKYFASDFKIIFVGWGRRKYGEFARKIAKIFNFPFLCLEDGFIRSVEIGKSDFVFSIVIDEKGIYYDATRASKLEDIINTYDFQSDTGLIQTASDSLKLLIEYNITKYNHAPNFHKADLANDTKKQILVVAQTAGDMSLKYGMTDSYSTNDLLAIARKENPDATLYLKLHPDVLHGIKKSDIDLKQIHKDFTIISEDVNALTLLKSMDKVYTKTSQMGFEALLLGKEVVCFGVPFYSGWGLTDDRIPCNRRVRRVTPLELFAAAYILYPVYYNPYTRKDSDIIDTIQTIVAIKNAK